MSHDGSSSFDMVVDDSANNNNDKESSKDSTFTNSSEHNKEAEKNFSQNKRGKKRKLSKSHEVFSPFSTPTLNS